MESTQRERPRRAALEVLAQLVWIVGAFGSYFAGATLHAAAGLGVLGATFGVTLLLASLAIGWRALPALLIALLLQAPLLVGLGIYTLTLPLGHDPYPCFFFAGTSLQQLETFTVIAALSAPLGFLLRLRGGGGGLRWFARRAAPLATVLAAALAVLGALRLARLPTPDRYVDSLPLHATIPSPRAEPCAPIDDKRDPAHDPGWRYPECATPEFDARGVSFHFHADASESEPSYYSLHYRAADGRDRSVYLGFSRTSVCDLPVRRDDALDLFFVQRGQRLGIVSADRWRWSVSLFEVRSRVAPPLGFWIASLVGLVVALACFGASSALGEVAAGEGKPGEAWINARRGDLSLVALAAVAASSALLFAALVMGFLV